MKYTFQWIDALKNGEYSPHCFCDTENGFNAISCFLTDDGGFGFQKSISYLENGLNDVIAVKNGTINSKEWHREDWCAEIQKKTVRVLSVYDETFSDLINTNDFEIIIENWIIFLKNFKEFEATTEVICTSSDLIWNL